MVRNGGGNIRFALRDILIVDQLFTLQDLVIIHHTDCGTLLWTEEQMREGVKGAVPKESWEMVEGMEFGANEESVSPSPLFFFVFNFFFLSLGVLQLLVGVMLTTAHSMVESVKGDLQWVKAHPLIRQQVKDNCQGFVYDIKTGKLDKVEI